MGHCVSRDSPAGQTLPQENDEVSSKGFSRSKKTSDSSGKGHRIVKVEHFSGIARIELIQAKMQFKDKWFACVSIGEQTFRTANSKNTDKPVWKSEKKVVLENNGPRLVHVSVFETNLLTQNNLVGYCELDLSDVFDSPVKHQREVHVLYDPNTKSRTVGTITVSYSAEDPEATEKSFACRLLSLMDFDESGELSLSEFSELVKAFGNKISNRELEELFVRADRNGDGKVTADELAKLLAVHSERTIFMKRCPVCGDELGSGDALNDMIHLSLCFDEGTGNQIMTGGFLTEKQASYGWMFKLSEWANLSTYDVGLKEGANAAHILVFDRRTQRLVEELIDNKIVLAMRAIYQSKLGLTLLDAGTKNMLLNMSQRQGERMNSVESAAEIPGFIEFFKDRINIDEFKYPVQHYKTFNEFFVRELKQGARPIEHSDNDGVAVCGADCRLMVFTNTDDATRFWIKGRKFSIAGLLGDEIMAKDFEKGSLAIFRLAPQDYHRFHVPVSGKLGEIVDIPGHLYTVNPIAVNSKYCNVFTENKRAVCVISTYEFGKVAFVAIGATMVGSITFTKKQGDRVQKGDELGYFSFGGSTCICVFQQKAIEFDEDLLANSERSLETLVSMGMTLGVSKALSYDTELERPTQKDSVVGLNNDVSRQGITATNSLNVRGGHLGLEGLPDDFVQRSNSTGSFCSPGSSTTSSHGRSSQGRNSHGRSSHGKQRRPGERIPIAGTVHASFEQYITVKLGAADDSVHSLACLPLFAWLLVAGTCAVSLLLVGARSGASEESASGQQVVGSGIDDSKHGFPYYSPPGTGPGGRLGPAGTPASRPPSTTPKIHEHRGPRRHHKRRHARHHKQDSDESTARGRRLLQDVNSEELVASGSEDKKHFFPHYSPPCAPGRPGPRGDPRTPTPPHPPSSSPSPHKHKGPKGKPGKGPGH